MKKPNVYDIFLRSNGGNTRANTQGAEQPFGNGLLRTDAKNLKDSVSSNNFQLLSTSMKTQADKQKSSNMTIDNTKSDSVIVGYSSLSRGKSSASHTFLKDAPTLLFNSVPNSILKSCDLGSGYMVLLV